MTPLNSASTVPAMKEITAAINVRQGQIKTLQGDVEALQRAASVLGGKTTGKATRQPKTKSKRKQKGRGMSAAARKAVSRRMKRYWAERKKPSAPVANSPAQPTATQKRKRAPMSAAAKKAMSKRLKAYWAKRKK